MSFHHWRPVAVPVLRRAAPAVAVVAAAVFAAAGCTASGGTEAVVPSPDTKAAAYCRSLDHRLPQRVDGLDRDDPSPASALTAGWGDPAIILRCGVVRPAAMGDENADGVDVNGVGWLVEQQSDGSYRFTSTLRKAYVEVTLPKQRKDDGLAPLTDLAGPVKKSVPEGIA
ncbi:DUF3515 domain-containing protein [Streptomyces sp. NPDC050560]|uniref:DUF3515 domain-containing protein n=1 Tax=Streptomyces sp. NPDC050560 TaxID=3365630 RepID=UPI0037B22A26